MRRMSGFIYARKDWPRFHWNAQKLAELLASVRHQQGRLVGHMESLGFRLKEEAVLQTLTDEVIKTSEIEGEHLNAEKVRSSIAQRLGIDIGALTPADRHVDGIVEILLDATRNYDQPLTKERLFSWHAALFPTGRSGMLPITVGAWRTDARGPMQVVSGYVGRERVHYQAPDALHLEKEMALFIETMNSNKPIDPVLKAALAHLWFVTLHPFDDGNGRIARAIADMLLARSEGSAQRFYSMSAQIRLEREAYYDILEWTQIETMDITKWMEWFLNCLGNAIAGAEKALETVLTKARFWKKFSDVQLNIRQRNMINRLLNGFSGKLTSSKWAKVSKCSQDTALRDIQELIQKDILEQEAAQGRSTSYILKSL